jgi:N-methylhydantoinase A
MTGYRVAVDIGGTFTDLCVLEEGDAQLRIAKVASTANPIDAVIDGIDRLGVPLTEVTLFSHGTTVATNALITRRLPPAAMITTAGFRDVIEIGRGTKDHLWDAYHDVVPPYIRRRDRLEVRERVAYNGDVVVDLDEQQAREVARILRRRGVVSVAVCFINAYANPVNEQRMKEIVEQEMPGVAVCTSSDVLPEIFEHERFSTTVANAVLSPVVTSYINDLESALAERGYRSDLLLLHSGGGVMTPRGVERLPARLAASGLAAGAVACRHLARLAGFDNAIGLDMGGTSADISLVRDGELRTTDQWSVEYGHPICLPSIEVLTIGAGGGSIAWIDDAGSLRNGPQSAGTIPGPACYGRGGTWPTNTDACVVLGRLGTSLAGGSLVLDPALAAEAIQRQIAAPLNMDVEEAAHAILEVASANMADALRLVSIRRGYDPRDFALVAFGGAGALYGASLAQELSIPRVVVPPHPGISSALGCLLVDIQHDLAMMLLSPIEALAVEELEESFRSLERDAQRHLAIEGVAVSDMRFQRSIDMRYRGQWRSMAVPVAAPLRDLDDAVAAFHREHERAYSFRHDTAAVEVYRLNVKAVGATARPTLPQAPVEKHRPPSSSSRPLSFVRGATSISTSIYQRDDLRPGARIDGPAIIEQMDTTTLIPPAMSAWVDQWFNLIIDTEGGSE